MELLDSARRAHEFCIWARVHRFGRPQRLDSGPHLSVRIPAHWRWQVKRRMFAVLILIIGLVLVTMASARGRKNNPKQEVQTASAAAPAANPAPGSPLVTNEPPS